MIVNEYASQIYSVDPSGHVGTRSKDFQKIHGPVAISRPIGSNVFIAGFGAGWPDPQPNTAGVATINSNLTIFQEQPFQDGLKHRIHYIDIFKSSSGETFLIAVGYGLGYLYYLNPNNISFGRTMIKFPSGIKPRHFIQLDDISDCIAVISESERVLLWILKYSAPSTFTQIAIFDFNDIFGPDITGSEVKYHNGTIYTSIRSTNGNGFIVQLTINSSTGAVASWKKIEVGKTPRYFDIIDGKLIVGNQDSKTVQVIDIEAWKVVSTTSFDPYQPRYIMNIDQ